jgi:hypothetical protein
MGAILPPLFSGHNYLFARHVRTVYNRMIHVEFISARLLSKQFLEINNVLTQEPGSVCEC